MAMFSTYISPSNLSPVKVMLGDREAISFKYPKLDSQLVNVANPASKRDLSVTLTPLFSKIHTFSYLVQLSNSLVYRSKSKSQQFVR